MSARDDWERITKTQLKNMRTERDALRKACEDSLIILEYIAAELWDDEDLDNVAMLRRQAAANRLALKEVQP